MERAGWLWFAVFQSCYVFILIDALRGKDSLFSLVLGSLIIIGVPVGVGGLSMMWGLMLGHAACIQSVKSHLLRLLGSLEDEERSLDSHAAESSSLKQLKLLAVVHAQLMKRTKSLLGPSVSVGLFMWAYLLSRTRFCPDPYNPKKWVYWRTSLL